MELDNSEYYTGNILKTIDDKFTFGICWGNEFGSIHKAEYFKEKYKTIKDVKVHYYNANDVIYFKVVPSYFSLKYSHYFWHYYDGYIQNNTVYWSQMKK